MADKAGGDEIDLKAMMKAAKTRPMNFALAPGKSKPVVLVMDKRMEPARLALQAKRQGIETAKLVSGTMRVEGSRLVLETPDKVQAQLLRAFKQMLKDHKIMLKPVAPGLPEDDDE